MSGLWPMILHAYELSLTYAIIGSDHADKLGYGVVRQFVGHGVGRVFHADPVVLHYSKCS